MTAKQLIEKHNLNQAQAAKLLGLSQPAISLYASKMRGQALSVEGDAEIEKLVDALASFLAEDNLSYKEFIPKFCEIWKSVV